jgi:hypothetical protein
VAHNTGLPSSVYLRCRCVALLDVLIVRLRRLLAAASVSILNANRYKPLGLPSCVKHVYPVALSQGVILFLSRSAVQHALYYRPSFNKPPRGKWRGIVCHVGLDKPAPDLIRGHPVGFLDSGVRRNDGTGGKPPGIHPCRLPQQAEAPIVLFYGKVFYWL